MHSQARIFNVMGYGMKPGNSDQPTAIANALALKDTIAAAQHVGGGTVFFPLGPTREAESDDGLAYYVQAPPSEDAVVTIDSLAPLSFVGASHEVKLINIGSGYLFYLEANNENPHGPEITFRDLTLKGSPKQPLIYLDPYPSLFVSGVSFINNCTILNPRNASLNEVAEDTRADG